MRAFSLLLIFTTLLVSACSSIGDSSKNLDEVENTPLSSTSAVTETPRVNLETSASPTIEPTIFPSPIDAQGEIAQPPIATSVERLSQASPWLIYMKGYESASITNSDGSGLFALPYEVSGAVVPPYDASNENPLLAVISDDSIFKDPPVLIIVSFPEMEVIQEIALQSCDLLHPGCIPDEEADVYFQPKWSPDGRYVAFVGAIDGPSSDLYLYDSLSNSIRRLTTGENQVGNFFWSPDSRWVVHEEVSHFNGWVVEAMWAASSVNDEVRWLYSPSTKYGQELLGWIDSDRFITFEHSWDGDSNLRLVSIRNGTGPSLFPGYFFEPFLDPDTGTVAFAPLLGAPNTNIAEPGIYLVSIRSTTPRRVPIDDINILGWYRQVGHFKTSIHCADVENGFLGFTPKGSIDCIRFPSSITSPNGKWAVSTEGSLNLLNSDGDTVNSIQGLDTGSIYWRLDSNGFFLIQLGELYYVEVPNLRLHQVLDTSSDSVIEPRYSHMMWIGK